MKKPKIRSKKTCHSVLPRAEDMVLETHRVSESAQSLSSAYQLAFADQEFIYREEQRGLRLLMEWQKVEQTLNDYEVDATWVIFGSARIPSEQQLQDQKSRLDTLSEKGEKETYLTHHNRLSKGSQYYAQAEKLSAMLSDPKNTGINAMVVTGGGPGIMEAANRGANQSGYPSIGLNIVLPREQEPNRYISPEFCFQFHYFAVRKMHFLMRAKAVIGFPGGFGTLDEVLETLTLMQTGRIKKLPVVLFGQEFWQSVINFEQLLSYGLVADQDLKLFHFADTAEQAIAHIKDFYRCEKK